MLMGLCVLHITNECNLKCQHCYASSGTKLSNELSYREILSIVDELEKLSFNYITISGGEPFMRSDIFDIIQYITSKNIHVMITSNGTLLNDENLKRCKELNIDSIQISLDSHKKDINDYFRGVPGAFDKAVRGVELCKKHGIKVSIMSTLSSVNKDHVRDLIELAVSLKVNGFAMERFVPEGRGGTARELTIAPEDLKQCLEILNEYSQKNLNCIFSTNDPLYLFVGDKHKFIYQLLEENSDLCGGCSVGKMGIVISPEGNLALCTRFYNQIGSIRENSIAEILHRSELVKTLCNRNLLQGKCGVCKYRTVCGGCRGWAYQISGDYLAEDSLCWLSYDEIS